MTQILNTTTDIDHYVGFIVVGKEFLQISSEHLQFAYPKWNSSSIH